ncbi:MAG: CrcB family protein, partial [Acidobacteria bacterium]|nr:CrcB family protein [Acidobacteriota bacterium]
FSDWDVRVNVFGSAMLGLLVGYFGSSASADLRLGLFVGVLGGFTTFSTFAVESGNLARGGFASTAAVYVAVSVLAGLVFALAGLHLGELIAD